MYDRAEDAEDSVSTTAPVTEVVQELKTVAFLLNGLYQQLATERDALVMAGGQITQSVADFTHQLHQLKITEQRLQGTLIQSIREESLKATQAMAREVGQTLANTVTDQLEHSFEYLTVCTQAAKTQLEDYRETLQRSTWWRWLGFVVIALASGLIGGFVTHEYFPDPAFTPDQWAQMSAGKTLMNAWDKLDKKEQDRILQLGKL